LSKNKYIYRNRETEPKPKPKQESELEHTHYEIVHKVYESQGLSAYKAVGILSLLHVLFWSSLYFDRFI